MYAGDSEIFVGNSPEVLLRQHLLNVFSKNQQSEDSLGYSRRFGSRFRVFRMSDGLRSLHALHSSPLPDQKWPRRAAFTFGLHGPRNFEYGYPPEVNNKYLAQCLQSFSSSTSMQFFFQISEGIQVEKLQNCETIPALRHHFFAGLAAARRNLYTEALRHLNHYLRLQEENPDSPLSPYAVEEARRALIDIYRIKGDVVQMQRILVQTFLNLLQLIRRVSMKAHF